MLSSQGNLWKVSFSLSYFSMNFGELESLCRLLMQQDPIALKKSGFFKKSDCEDGVESDNDHS